MSFPANTSSAIAWYASNPARSMPRAQCLESRLGHAGRGFGPGWQNHETGGGRGRRAGPHPGRGRAPVGVRGGPKKTGKTSWEIALGLTSGPRTKPRPNACWPSIAAIGRSKPCITCSTGITTRIDAASVPASAPRTSRAYCFLHRVVDSAVIEQNILNLAVTPQSGKSFL